MGFVFDEVLLRKVSILAVRLALSVSPQKAQYCGFIYLSSALCNCRNWKRLLITQ